MKLAGIARTGAETLKQPYLVDVLSRKQKRQVAPGNLRQMLLAFHDPKVGYVSAPGMCDLNAKKSWTARGRLTLECHFHGSLQAGYNRGFVPMCIGSHYAVRTKALKEIGGLGPELAEDHSTTFLMTVHGWIGIHSIDAEAHVRGRRPLPTV